MFNVNPSPEASLSPVLLEQPQQAHFPVPWLQLIPGEVAEGRRFHGSTSQSFWWEWRAGQDSLQRSSEAAVPEIKAAGALNT